jgi:cobalt/nickel transport system permease protein
VRHALLTPLAVADSPVHRLSASWKLALALSVVLLTVAVPRRSAWLFGGVALALLLAARLGRIPLRFLATRLLLLAPVVAGVALLSLLQPDGLAVASFLAVRSMLCLTAMLLLTSTTRFSELLLVLRRVGLPSLLLTTVALMYRYLFVLVEETERMQRARTSRTLRARRVQTWRSTAGLAGQLFVRSTERAERIYAAMCARGWR